ncbi:MAG TPA: hypothetical protein VFL47_02450 [Flavisolibacter sp.]|nr:hypothetical protein [Flavisolibacter sp.]
MHKLFFFLLLFILGVNAVVVWQNHKSGNCTAAIGQRLVAGLRTNKAGSGSLLFPGSFVVFN